MKEEDRDGYINYRMESAFDSLDSAKILLEHKKWNSAINRLYYTCFYAVSALLLKNGIQSKTHKGLKNQFSIHYIKTGKIDISFGKMYADLFDWRQKGDYGDYFNFTEEDVRPLVEPVTDFLKIINGMLQINNNEN